MKHDEIQVSVVGSIYGAIGGVIHTNTVSVSNVGTGEDDLQTYSVAASALASTGDRLRIRTFGVTAINNNTKNIKAYFAGSLLGSITLTGASDDEHWEFEIDIIRNGTNSVLVKCSVLADGGAGNGVLGRVFVGALTPTLTSAQTFKMTGEGVANADITQYATIIEWHPNP